mgnify:CR=1 FL=1
MKFNLNYRKTQYLKGIAIILVLLSHVSTIKFAGNIGVGIFLLLSGYGVYDSYLKNGLKSYWRKKIKKVLLPYWIFNLVWIIIDYFRGISYSLNTILLSFITYKNVIDITMWYISYLLLWYVLFWIIFKLFKNKYMYLLFMFLSVILSLLLGLKGIFGIGGGAQYYCLMFPLGVMLRYLYENYENKINKFVLPIFSFLLFLFLYAYNNMYGASISYIRMVALIVSIVLILVIVFAYVDFDIPKKSIIKIYGKYSYFIYLIEGAFLNKYDFLESIIENRNLYILLFIELMLIISIPIYKLYNKLNLNKFL